MAWNDTKTDGVSSLPASEYNDMVDVIEGKQDTLVSASNIKTINSTSLLGSGNIDTPNTTYTSSDFDIKDLTDSTSLRTTWNAKQDALVSGTTIKTINSTNLLGSGNIEISGGSGVALYTTVGVTGSGADYECDGTSDNVQIQQAIDAVNSAGAGTVFIMKGAYSTSSYITMKSNVELRGEGWGTRITMTSAGSSALIGATTQSFFSIRDIYFDHNCANKTGGSTVYVASDCHDYQLENLYTKNGYANNIIVGGYNGSIKDCVSDYCEIADGILVHTGHDITVNGCISMNTQGATGNGIAVYSSDNTAYNVTISNCVSHNNASLGFQIERAKECVISNCVSYENNAGFGTNGLSTAIPTDVSYINCYSHDNVTAGFNLNVGQNIMVSGCMSEGDGEDAVRIGGSYAPDSITVTNSIFRNITGSGIRCYNTSSSTDNMVFTNNIIDGASAYGIECQDAQGVTVSGNRIISASRGITTGGAKATITNNYVKCTGAGQYTTGIALDHADAVDSIISGNFVEDAGQHGIDVNANNVIVSNNIVKNSGKYGSGTNNGIRLASSLSRINVTNNTLYDNQGSPTQTYGLYISSGCDYITVGGNTIYDNATGSIYGSVGANGVTLATLTGTETFTNKTLTDPIINLDANGFIFDTTPTTDHTCSGLKAPFTAGAAFTIGQLGYINSSGQPLLASCTAESTLKGMTVLASGTISSGSSGTFLIQGIMRDDTWNWTPGNLLYASSVAGSITQVMPTTSGHNIKILGYAISADVVYFNPSNDYHTVA